MRKERRMGLAGWFTALFLVVPSIACAELKDLLRHFEPSIAVEEKYTNNLYLTSTNRKADFITSIYPGFRVSTLPRSATTGEFQSASASPDVKYGVDLDYRLGLVYYGKEEDNNFTSHQGTLNAWYMLNRYVSFRVRDYLVRSEEGRERDYSATSSENQYLLSTQRGRRSVYLRNVFEPSFEYQFGRDDRFSILYRNNIYENQSRLSQDSRENFINPKLSYWFNIRNGVSLEYGLTFADFDRSPDFTGHMATGRYTYRFDPKTSVFGEYTYLNRDFRSPGNDYDVYRPSLGVEHAFSPTFSGNAQLGYFWHDPSRGSTEGGFFYRVNLTKRQIRTTYSLSLEGGYQEDYFTAENLGFTKYHRAIGTINHQPLQRMVLSLSSTLERASYGDGRIDRIWGIRGNGSYRVLKWLSFNLELSHRQNHSNNDGRDYGEYAGNFRITATY